MIAMTDRKATPTLPVATMFLAGRKQATNTTAYPIIAVTYFLAKTARSENNAVVQAFAKWIIEDFGPKNAEALGYVPLTGRPAEIALAQIAKINSI